MLVDLALVSCSLDDQCVQYSAKLGLQCGLRTHQLFGLGKRVQNFLDSVVRALEFNSVALLLTVKPARLDLKQTSWLPFQFKLVMHSHKDVSLTQCQVDVCLFYNIANNRNPTVLTVNLTGPV